MNTDFLKHLQSLELFKDLSAEDLSKFLNECQEEYFPAGFVIFNEGDQPDKFYIILSGRVEIWKDFGTDFADVLAIRGPGASFGEMSLIDDLPRSATVRTLDPVRALFLDKDPFRKIIQENPSVSLLIMKTVSKMVRVSNETFQYGLRQRNQKLEQAYEELKNAQQELIRGERLSTLGKFASMIIHDLRNPLSVIRGYAELLLLTNGQQERATSLSEKLLSEVDRLNRMVGELLDYSRGNIRLNLGVIFLKDLFSKLVENNQQVAESRSIEIQVQNDVSSPILADQDRLYRVLSNLLDNAKKAMRQGGKITLKARTEADFVLIEVQDTGEGMPADVKNKLFEPFFSASAAGGTGLGLLVVSNVIEAHRGRIEVESTPGVGTTFKIFIPLHPTST
jgi:signal transduction histidine kinase